MTEFFQHIKRVYEIMYERSELNEYDERIFTGKLSRVFQESGASSTYYSPIRELLLSPLNDPCIEIRQRGNVSQSSIILLRHPPPDDWSEVTHRDLTRRGGRATLGLEVEGGAARLERLEKWRESIGGVNLSEFIRTTESRLSALEQERGKREHGKN